MASFKIMKATAKRKTWKAADKNTKTGRSMTIQGGQTGTAVGKIILRVRDHLLQDMMKQA